MNDISSSPAASPLPQPPRRGCTALLGAMLTLLISALIIGGILLYKGAQKVVPTAGIADRSTTTISAMEVRSIRETGEWEFLSIATEEFVERRQAHLTGDDILACIYRGRLRIGTDLRQLSADDIRTAGDSVVLRLPDVHLLSGDFIDEARTTVFHEEGRWDAAAKQALYEQARKQMMARALTEDNLKLARENATEQLLRLFTPMGFKALRIEWKK